MPKCFVIQPFDKGKFDRRYDAVFAPAITAAGLEPYRVDKNPAVAIPMEDVERGIRDSAACLVEITTDNPNVWYELGYAIANGKDVVLICSTERGDKFPFDVQSRAIVIYNPDAPQGFVELEKDITARLQAILANQEEREKSPPQTPPDVMPLPADEIAALASVMGRAQSPKVSVYFTEVFSDMGQAGYTQLAGVIALKSLERKQLIETYVSSLGYSYCYITEKGVSWIIENRESLKLTSS